jgi:tetratricopeptide (TPR) repeat protein
MPTSDDAAHWTAVEEAAELIHEERYREAMVELRRVLGADAKNHYAFFFLGVAFFEIGELESARDAYGACLKLAPGHLGARVSLSHVLRQLGDSRGAIREGMAALSRSPGDGDALYAVALAHHARGDDAATRTYLEAYLATDPELEGAAQARAILEELARPGAAADD